MKKEKEERKEREKENYRNEWKKKMKGTEHKKNNDEEITETWNE